MRYEVAPLPPWSELDGEDRVRVARHYRLPLDDTDVLLLPHGRPGWLRFPVALLGLLESLDGQRVAGLTAAPQFAAAADSIRALYDGGLLFIGNRTGLRAVPGPRDGAEGPEPPTALLLKLTGACDMACDYCYDFDARRWPGRLDVTAAQQLVTECLRPGHTLTLMFHGGEPLLRFAQLRTLVDFADRRAAEVAATVRFTIQTNGLHFTEPVVEFLRRHRFAVGVSLDGARLTHDRHRVDHAGRGTFDRIMENFERFDDFMRHEVGYISVVAADTDRDDLEDAWRFFRELRVRTWKLLPADAEGRAAGQVETGRFRQTFIGFLDARLTEVLDGRCDPPYLTNLIELIEPFLSLERLNLCLKMPCGAADQLLVLDANGAVRGCDSADHPAFHLVPPPGPQRRNLPLLNVPAARPAPASDIGVGVVTRSRSTAAARSLRQREHWLLSEAPCASCAWLHHCSGTCPARALLNNGTLYSVDELECASRLTLFPRILADVSSPGSLLRRYHDDALQASRTARGRIGGAT